MPVSKPDRPARILIVDDDPAMRELLDDMVKSLGHEAIPVPDGTAALAAIAGRPPDLVLSDVSMPGLNGFEVCRRLKTNPKTRLIPVVLITGIGDEFKVQGIEAGADDFLGKPFSSADLRVRIRALLRMKAFTDELESAEAVLCSLGKTIEAKDPYTEGHCERLGEYGVALGQALGLGEEDIRALRIGGFLHDLGKVGVPEAILLKPGPLTPVEREIMHRHPVIGETICRPLRSLQAVLPVIRHHHERQDGSGYPDGLQGETVPLTARILQVVDLYDALTTDRPYRRALSPGVALQTMEMEAERGWWDLRVIRAFRQIVRAPLSPAKGGKAMAPRILVVEDNLLNLELVVAVLEREGCEVLVAETADAGLQLAATNSPDLILMDLQLPGMTGYEAIRHLKADPATAAIPVVVLTAQVMGGSQARAQEAGCDGFLPKPVDTHLLQETIRRFLPKREAP